MSNTVIKVEGLGKEYKIGALHKKHQHDTLRDKIASGIKSAKKHLVHRKSTMLGAEKFWALRNVSFEVKQGEVLGIIGKNGAGKSTLLKMLCKVTSPTEGKAMLKGRVGTLLEVGTGFHLELTGRENIFLSGAILGMKKAYIEQKIDEIITFSGIEKFIDTPVKRYSNGMRVRLGFAVAAHLEPEILLIDEVLAVGDIAFQDKCLGKMNDITDSGRTILLVSHNMASIEHLCSRVIVLESGAIAYLGHTKDAIDYYLRVNKPEDPDDRDIFVNTSAFNSSEEFRVTNVEVLDLRENLLEYVKTGDNVIFRIHFVLDSSIPDLGIMLEVYSERRIKLLCLSTHPISGYHIPPQQRGVGYIDCHIPRFPFVAGKYQIDVGTLHAAHSHIHTAEGAVNLRIRPADIYGSGFKATVAQKAGFVTANHQWKNFVISSLKRLITCNFAR